MGSWQRPGRARGVHLAVLVAVITLRRVPLVPFSAANYAAGLTAIRGRDFVIGTAVGIIPGVLVYTSLGASLGGGVPLDQLHTIRRLGVPSSSDRIAPPW